MNSATQLIIGFHLESEVLNRTVDDRGRLGTIYSIFSPLLGDGLA